MRLDDICQTIAGIMRYAYQGISHDVPLNEEEWYGKEGESGIKDFIVSLFRDEIKRAYKLGYTRGAAECFRDVNRDDGLVFSIDESLIGAERSFCKWQGDV
jgi:hypothetical protein